MALQFCPNCMKERITWSIDADRSSFTMWDCWDCGYSAEEDESKERV